MTLARLQRQAFYLTPFTGANQRFNAVVLSGSLSRQSIIRRLVADVSQTSANLFLFLPVHY